MKLAAHFEPPFAESNDAVWVVGATFRGAWYKAGQGVTGVLTWDVSPDSPGSPGRQVKRQIPRRAKMANPPRF